MILASLMALRRREGVACCRRAAPPPRVPTTAASLSRDARELGRRGGMLVGGLAHLVGPATGVRGLSLDRGVADRPLFRVLAIRRGQSVAVALADQVVDPARGVSAPRPLAPASW